MKKQKLIISLLLVILSFVFIYNSSTKETTSAPPIGGMDTFLIGAMNTGDDSLFKYVHDTLGFNLWHQYNENKEWGGRHYPAGWTILFAPADTLFADIADYGPQARDVLGRINNHGMKALMMRPKVEWLCYGARSDYQCEDMSLVNPDLWFYSFQSPNHKGIDIPDGDDTVRYCRLGIDNAGMVVNRLRANSEQCHRNHNFDAYRHDSECDWLIKPRIRIDSMFAHTNPDSPVCSIKVIAQDGQTILKNVVLKGRNFLDGNLNYNGRYLEEFKIYEGDDTLIIHTDWGDQWAFSARGSFPQDEWRSKADIQVYWYGNCDMWIDYVRVDNDVAHNLFGSGQTHDLYEQWLEWEAKEIASQSPASYKFYIELFEFNNIPCMAYVSRKLDSITYSVCSKHISLVCIPIPFTYAGHVPWEDRLTVQNVNHFKTYFIERMGVSEFMLGIYPFNSSYEYPEPEDYPTWTKIPNTLPNVEGQGILARDTTPQAYDNWLQDYFDQWPYSFEYLAMNFH